MKDWAKNLKAGKKNNDGVVGAASGGRPTALDALSIQQIKSVCAEAAAKSTPLNNPAFHKLVWGEKINTLKRRFLDPDRQIWDEDSIRVSAHTLKQLKGERGMRHCRTQDLTDARLFAQEDMRAIYINAVTAAAIAEFLPAAFKWNAGETVFLMFVSYIDCTAYLCTGQGDGTYWIFTPLTAEEAAEYDRVCRHPAAIHLLIVITEDNND